ncbi:deoxyribonuclease IV [Chlamydiales bacterium]|nr:deoxyribonuclease IV [Chlamydiales bacterium]
MTKKLLIGAHTSAAGGVFNALIEGQKIGATTIQLFTSNQKQWKGRPVTDETVEKWKAQLEKTEISHVMCHDSYLINLGCPHEENLIKSRSAFKEELVRCQRLDLTYLNFHPGAALKEPVEQCLNLIVESLLGFEKEAALGNTRLLLESTAGQGSTVGWKFEELGYIIERTHGKVPVGVCIDTCHIFAAGYDIRTKEGWDQVLEEFDQKVGLEHLYAFHVNDSLKPCGSRVDRHRDLGEGEIGMESFKVMMTHEKMVNLPKYLETPGGPPQWEKEIALLRKFAEE